MAPQVAGQDTGRTRGATTTITTTRFMGMRGTNANGDYEFLGGPLDRQRARLIKLANTQGCSLWGAHRCSVR